MKKTGRNDPCPCGSGRKFKKCCESKMIGGRFMATKIDPGSAPPIQKAVSMTSLFQARLAATPKKPLAKEEAVSAVSNEPASLPEENAPEKETIC